MAKEIIYDICDAFSDAFRTSYKKGLNALEMSVLIADLSMVYYKTYRNILFYNHRKSTDIDTIVHALRKLVQMTVDDKDIINEEEKTEMFTGNFKVNDIEDEEYDQFSDDLIYVIKRIDEDDEDEDIEEDSDDEDDDSKDDEEDDDVEVEFEYDVSEEEIGKLRDLGDDEIAEYYKWVEESPDGILLDIIVSEDVRKLYFETLEFMNNISGKIYEETEIMMFLIICKMPPELKTLIELLDEDPKEVQRRNSEIAYSKLKKECGNYLIKKKWNL